MNINTNLQKSLQYDSITKQEYINNAGLTSIGSPSEIEVFELRSKGHNIIEIALKLNCSERTITRRIKNIKMKIAIYELKKTLLQNINKKKK